MSTACLFTPVTLQTKNLKKEWYSTWVSDTFHVSAIFHVLPKRWAPKKIEGIRNTLSFFFSFLLCTVFLHFALFFYLECFFLFRVFPVHEEPLILIDLYLKVFLGSLA